MTPEDMEELRYLLTVAQLRSAAFGNFSNLSECKGKFRFDSYQAATQSLYRKRLGHLANAYHCRHCHGYHVGSIRSNRLLRIAGKKRRNKCAR